MSAVRSVVVHGHFYQPPREEPWLDLVEREPSAAPFHDWNERIERECYRAVVAARLPGPGGRIAKIVNTLRSISFNFGPTLLEWMDTEAPGTYGEILAADRASQVRLGHGNAIATPYHHIILPLASRRDKITEVRWGIADFKRRFGRDPEGMWLPETAVDEETLEIIAAEEIRFTILAPHQVVIPPPYGLPGRCKTAGHREIAVFCYNGPMSHDVAFGPLVRDAGQWARRTLAAPAPETGPSLVSVATDGETYGHHHKFGEMALASMLDQVGVIPNVVVENFASFLVRHPAEHDVVLNSPSSWSCIHGVERWRSDCGCRIQSTPVTSQAWRAPLRTGLERLADELHLRFATEGRSHFIDPWRARDSYRTVGAPSERDIRGRELLEMERNALRMFTSCGWFFDDVGGIETIQILRYAGRAIELAGADSERLEAGLLADLAAAVSNDPKIGTAADLYRTSVRPLRSGPDRAAAGYAAVTAINPDEANHIVGAYVVGAGEAGTVEVRHSRTGRVDLLVATVHRTSALGVEVDLVPHPSGEPRTIGLEHLAERERGVVRTALRREALRDVLSADALERLAHGEETYHAALADALLALIPRTAAVPGEIDIPRIERALDLLALEEQHVPFDAQTRLYRLLSEGGPALRRLLAPLALRFGFVHDPLNHPVA
ncbi:MAG: DUF3536 domain-containing protein [Gemmatimonadota bacterium]